MIQSTYVLRAVKNGARVDGRSWGEYRDIKIEYGVSSKSAEGSARVHIGETVVVAGVKLDIGSPFPDKPDEGTIMVNVEMSPVASPLFEPGPPSIEAIEMSRVTDRGIRECHALDFKKLCITAGESVWLVYIDIYPLNDAGNLFDACNIAAMAALQDTIFPKLDGKTINYKEKSKQKLPLSRLPISCTVWKIGSQYVVDPSADEEAAASARLTVVFTEDGTICAMQKGKDGALTQEDIAAMVDLAEQGTTHVRGSFTA